jgi:hypothetical protein
MVRVPWCGLHGYSDTAFTAERAPPLLEATAEQLVSRRKKIPAARAKFIMMAHDAYVAELPYTARVYVAFFRTNIVIPFDICTEVH